MVVSKRGNWWMITGFPVHGWSQSPAWSVAQRLSPIPLTRLYCPVVVRRCPYEGQQRIKRHNKLMFLIVQYLCQYFQAPNSLAVAKLSTKFVSRRVQFPESFDKLSATSNNQTNKQTNKQTNQKVQKLQRFLKLSSSGRPRTLVAAGHGIPHVVRVDPILGKARS